MTARALKSGAHEHRRASLPCGGLQPPLRRLQPPPLRRQVRPQGGQLLLAVRNGVAQVAQPGVGLRAGRARTAQYCALLHTDRLQEEGLFQRRDARRAGLRAEPEDTGTGQPQPAMLVHVAQGLRHAVARAALPSSSSKEAAWGAGTSGRRP